MAAVVILEGKINEKSEGNNKTIEWTG